MRSVPGTAQAHPDRGCPEGAGAVELAAALEKARSHLGEGRHAEAEELCQDVLTNAPDNAEALFIMGAAAAEDGRVPMALARLRAAAESGSGHVGARFYLAQLLMQCERFEEASQELAIIHAGDPDNPEVLDALADARDRAGDWQGARECWQRQMAAQQARAAQHPLAGLGIRVLDPGFAVARIGEMAVQLELFAKMGLLGWRPPMIGVLLAPERQIVNACFLDYFRPYIQVISDPALISTYVRLRDEGLTYDPVLVMLPNGKAMPDDRAMVAVNRCWEDQGRPPLLSLDLQHAARGRECLVRLGVPADAWFACLHVRTPGFLDEAPDSHRRFRNADIESYLPAVERIVARGGWVVRIGDPSMPPLPPLKHVVDYVHSPHKSDWMDIFLIAAARFFLGTTSGPWTVAHVFGTPVAMTNQVPFSERPFSGRDLYIPKPYRDRQTGNLLPFDAAMGPPFRHQFLADIYDRHGIDLLDNSAEEIVALVDEMLDRLDGRLADNTEDAALRARFDALATSEEYGFRARIGRAFLRKYRELVP